MRYSGLTALLTLLVVGMAAAAAPGETAFTGEAAAPKEPLSLWYRRPASKWVEALAIGNGRLGAMMFGGVGRERLQLNEGTLWAAGPYDPANPEALEALPEVRRLIFAGKYREAHALIDRKMMAKPLREMPYQPAGDLLVTFPETRSVEGYRRELDLDGAVARVSYSAGGTHFTREAFASAPDHVIALRISGDKPGQVSFSAGLTTPQKGSVTTEGADTLVLRGINGEARGIEGKLKFQVRVRVLPQGGTVSHEADSVAVHGADSAVLLISAATSYRNYEDVSGDPEALSREALAAASAKSWGALLKAHQADYRRLFRRVKLDLGAPIQKPTDERIAAFNDGHDPQLAALYFQFGRYLLLSSSRPGGQPATLQGLWNDQMSPPWDSKYTININTEMNYWPAEPCNLTECTEPLVKMLHDLSETGARTAKVQYGARGWVAHHNTDLWRATGAVDGPQYGMWPSGGAWLCQHLWDHYDYAGDRKFLQQAYPVMKGAAQFFLDTLVPEPKHGWLVTCPSLSPENRHPFGTSICAGPTMDEQIARDLFNHCIRAAEILDTDADFRKQLAAARDKLAPNQIGKAGQLQEWLEDWDLEAPERHHRHVSHLYGLYPSAQITPRGTPKLAAAVRKSLELRGDDATGWGLGWRLNLWARLLDGDHAYQILRLLLSPSRTYPNMFDAHPPFQIDGNFGGTAGIAEMLMQSHAGEIELLPAMPKAWPAGSISGLRARGGFEVGLSWRDGKLLKATVRSTGGRKCVVRAGAKTAELALKPGQEKNLGPELR